MKLIPILIAAVLSMLLTSCYTDGFGYVETGSYHPGYYNRGYYPGSYHGGYYGGHVVRSYPHNYRRHSNHYYGHNRRHDGDGRRRYHHNSGGNWHASNVSIGGWTPGRDRDRRWR